MRINEIKQAVMLCRAAGVTPFVWGHRGLGKSSLVKQLSQTLSFGFVDFRLGQCEASDIRGMPDKKDGATVFLPPNEIPRGGMTFEEVNKELEKVPEHERESRWLELQPMLNDGFLFLDEPNRGEDDTQQAVFQLVLDRRVGQRALPPGWSVVCAGNFMEGDYIVNGFNDAAFLDRFCHLVLSGGESTLDDWVGYMTEQHSDDAADIIEFASQNAAHLDGAVKGELGFEIQPSRRSWDAVARVNKAAKEGGYDSSVVTDVIAGLIGRELAVSYMNYSCPVKPRDLLNDGVKKHVSTLNTLTRGQLIGLTWGLVSYTKPQIEKDEIAEVACDYASWLCKHNEDKDVVLAFCRALLTDGRNKALDDARAAVLSNKNVAKLFAKVMKDKKSSSSFIFRINERPELAELLNRTVWGSPDDEQ